MGATAGAPVAADLVDAVCAETDGNPFFAREIMQHLRGGRTAEIRAGRRDCGAGLPLSVVPEGVRQVIARRRRQLAGGANRLLDVAAAVEGPFLFEPVRTVAGLSAADGLAALDVVLDADLVVPDSTPDRYAFATP